MLRSAPVSSWNAALDDRRGAPESRRGASESRLVAASPVVGTHSPLGAASGAPASPGAADGGCVDAAWVRCTSQRKARRPGESAEDHARRLTVLVDELVDSCGGDESADPPPPTLARIVRLLFYVLALNTAAAFAFRASELRRELKDGRKVRLIYFERFPAIIDGTDDNPYVMSAHDADFVFDTFKRSYATSWKCGRCKNRIDEVLLDGLPRPGVSSEEVRSALRAICNGDRETYACKWRFIGCFYFALTVFTTIGFGDFAPQKDSSKILVVVVLLVGGAVAVPCYSAIGSRAVHQLKFVGPVRRHLNSVMFAIGAGYLLAGGALFQYTEQKLADQDSFTYWNSCYFAFQTLTTLGLGDFTPSTKNVSVVTAWAYTIVGFGVVGAAASTVAVAIREHRKEALRHLKQLRKRHARTAMLRGHRAANSVRLWRRGSTGSASSLELGPGESANSAESADAAADGAARVQDAPPPQQDKPDLPAGECSVDNFDVAEHNDSKVG